MAPDIDNRLAICARQLGMARLRILELEEENHRLHLVRDSHPENDALWSSLSHYACDCVDRPEKEAEAFIPPENHDAECRYIKVYRAIKENVK